MMCSYIDHPQPERVLTRARAKLAPQSESRFFSSVRGVKPPISREEIQKSREETIKSREKTTIFAQKSAHKHPWADGNGRMTRLLMNWLQFEFGLIPSRIFADDKEDYIKALVETRESEDLSIFRRFMTQTMIRHLTNDINNFTESIDEDIPITQSEKPKTEERILKLLQENPKHTTKTLSEAIGITPKGIEKQLSKLKSQGRITRVGSTKAGSWKVTIPSH